MIATPTTNIPPHDLEAEASVLGAILIEREAIAKVIDLLAPEDFYRENSGHIYKAMLSLHQAGAPTDHITLSAELEKRGILEQVGGRAHLALLQEQTPTAANVEYYARRVKGLALKRQAGKLGAELTKLSNDNLLDASEALSAIEEPFHRLKAEIEALESGDSRQVPQIIRLSEVEPEEVHWLWWQRLPLGKVVLLDGDPGLGKSMMTLDLAARVSRGEKMPDGTDSISGGAGVVVLSAEDGLSDTIRPRLEAAEADLDRVATFTVSDEGGAERLIGLPQDLPVIETVIEEMEAKLLIIDPLMAYLATEVNSYRDQDVRRALAPLAKIAERTKAAVILVRHLNKASGGNPLYRGGGSIGIGGAGRGGLLVAKDPEDEKRRILAPIKNNLSEDPLSLAYRIVSAGKGSARVEWEGTSDMTATQLLVVNGKGEERTAIERAEAFLIELLSGGPVLSTEAFEKAREIGISEKTLYRARTTLGVRPNKQGYQGNWYWSLPGVDGSRPRVGRDNGDLGLHAQAGAEFS